MIKNIVFDIGKVMVTFEWKDAIRSITDSEDVVKKVANATVKGKYWDELDRGVMPLDEIFREWEALAPDCKKEIHDFFNVIPEFLNPFDYAEQWVNSYLERGFHVYFLSNFSEPLMTADYPRFTFMHKADGAIISYKVKTIKPDVAIYQALYDTYHLNPSECIFIDDRNNNCQMGKETGMHTVLFKSYEQAVADVDAIIEAEK